MSLQYIIDGYNITNHPLFTRIHKHNRSPQASLSYLIISRKLTGSSKNKVIIVFDGYPKGIENVVDEERISITFSRKISADEKINMLVEESSNRKNIVVVSDDKEIKIITRSLGARSMGIEEFLRVNDRPSLGKEKTSLKPELNYSQIHKINQELKNLWLKPK